MGYEKYPRGDYYGRRDPQDNGRERGSGRDDCYYDARDYVTAGASDRDRDYWGGEQDRDRDFGSYGQREYGNQGYARRDQQQGSNAQPGGGERYGQPGRQGRDEHRGSYASEGPRFGNFDRAQNHDDYGQRGPGARDWRGRVGGGHYGAGQHNVGQYGGGQHGGGQYGGGDRQRTQVSRNAPQGYDYDDRGFFARAGDEVRSWFGDEDAERRREADMTYDERAYNDRDDDYGSWRRSQIAAFDRDYDEYRRENRTKFESEFSTWRTSRQVQRESLNKVEEHMDVVGSDGSHVGTVDKVRGDRILLTKNDADAGGRHHSIPSSWVSSVDTKVTLAKTADEAKKHWRDEERNQALFGDDDRTGTRTGLGDKPDAKHDAKHDEGGDDQGRMLNRSFPGTY
jgi:hypothetical protein